VATKRRCTAIPVRKAFDNERPYCDQTGLVFGSGAGGSGGRGPRPWQARSLLRRKHDSISVHGPLTVVFGQLLQAAPADASQHP
jgi:hypothetical protein